MEKSTNQSYPRNREINLAVIVPVYNEEESIDPFIREVDAVLVFEGVSVKYVFIDDGSTDRTLEFLRFVSAKRNDVSYISFSRNFGKEAALTAGLDHLEADIAVFMDVDLQDPPEVVEKFIEKWREGYDTVYGIRVDRRLDTATKRTTSELFYKIFNLFAATPIPANVGDFRLIDKRVADAIKLLPERSRFMKGIFAWVGYSSIGVEYARPERRAGKTKFNYYKLWNFALDGITSFTASPLKLWTYIGFGGASIACLFGAFIFMRTFVMGVDVPGYASIMLVIIIMGSLNLMSLGLMGEYISRLFIEIKQRPIYLVAETSVRIIDRGSALRNQNGNNYKDSR